MRGRLDLALAAADPHRPMIAHRFTLPFYLALGSSGIALLTLGLLPAAREEITALWIGALRVGAIGILAIGVLTPWVPATRVTTARADRRGRHSTRVIALLALATALAGAAAFGAADPTDWATLLLAPLLVMSLIGAVRDDLLEPLAALGAYSTAVWPLLLFLEAPALVGLAFLLRLLWSYLGMYRAARR